MRAKTADWYEVKFSYAKVQEDGSMKNVTEQYVVEAMTFSEAESAIIENMSPFISSGDYKIKAIACAAYREVFFSENVDDDMWFKTKVKFITIDERTSAEKKTSVNYLVQSSDIEEARKSIVKAFASAVMDYTIASLSETSIVDVFEHKEKAKDGEGAE